MNISVKVKQGATDGFIQYTLNGRQHEQYFQVRDSFVCFSSYIKVTLDRDVTKALEAAIREKLALTNYTHLAVIEAGYATLETVQAWCESNYYGEYEKHNYELDVLMAIKMGMDTENCAGLFEEAVKQKQVVVLNGSVFWNKKELSL